MLTQLHAGLQLAMIVAAAAAMTHSLSHYFRM